MSPDIFQEKMSDLMAGLEFVPTYLDDLLIIGNSTFEDHLRQLQIVLRRLRRAGLKVNAEKSTGPATPNYPETTKEFPGYGPILQGYVEKEKPYIGTLNRPCRSWQKETEMD